MLSDIDDKSCVFLGLSGGSGLLRNKTPKLVSVDGWAMVPVTLPLKLSHTSLSVETGMAIKEIKSQSK